MMKKGKIERLTMNEIDCFGKRTGKREREKDRKRAIYISLKMKRNQITEKAVRNEEWINVRERHKYT